MNYISFNKEKDFELVMTELKKAKFDMSLIDDGEGLDIDTFSKTYSFKYLNWSFHRTKKHWKVETTPEYGLTKEKGIELYYTPFPVEMFDDPMCSKYGAYIRLAGHAGCVSPEHENGLWLEEGKCISYHIDNQCSLNFFIQFISNLNNNNIYK